MIFRKSETQKFQERRANEMKEDVKAFEELMNKGNNVDFHNDVEQLKTDEVTGIPFYIMEAIELDTSYGKMVKMYVKMLEKDAKGNEIFAVVRSTSNPIITKVEEIQEMGYIPTPAPVVIYKKKSQQTGNRYYSMEIYKE